jgi:hypothetical protein
MNEFSTLLVIGRKTTRCGSKVLTAFEARGTLGEISMECHPLK